MRRLKYVLGIFILFLMFQNQEAKAQIYVGGHIGGTSSSLTGIGFSGYVPDPKMYINFGASMRYNFSRRFAAQFELNYSGKGAAYSYDGSYNGMDGVITNEEKLRYMAVPMILQFKLGDQDSYFHLDAGMVYNKLIGNKYIGSISVTDVNGEVTEYTMASPYMLNTTDMSYVVGIGLVANGLNFGFRYEVGMNKVFLDLNGAPQAMNRAFTVSIGYQIKIY